MAAVIRPLGEEDLPELFAIRRVSFQDRSDFEDPGVRQRHAARLPYTRGWFEDGRLASAVVMFPFQVNLGVRRVAAGGLAGVLSAPEYRRRGYVKALLHDGLERLREAGTAWCLEFPFDPFFYATFGWQSVAGGFSVRLNAERLGRSGAQPAARRVTPDDATALAAFEDMYASWARDYNFSLVRNDQARPDWQRVFMDPAAARPRPAYLLQDAYCVLELSAERGSERLRVHDYAFRTPQGRRDLLAFWGNFRGQVETVDLRLPAGEPLLLDTANQPSPHQSVWQVRVVDVGRALAPLAGRQEASFCLRVHDDFCAWNDQTFRLVLGPEGTTVQPAAHTPDLSVDVRALPALLSGSLSAHAAMKAGMAEGELPCAEALAALAGGRTPYLSRADFF